MDDANTSPLTEKWRKLFQQAIEAREYAYSPYSNYKVGAALLTATGKIYKGCNIENVGFTSSVCAERTAIFKAVSEGETDFVAIAVATSNGGAPCGVCRQVMREFSSDLTVIIGNIEGEYLVLTLSDLLPYSFGPEHLPPSKLE
jgi:cytidine deaminase